MPKFNVHSSYFNHPKVKRLQMYCGPEADIYPIRLWAFCAEYFPDDGTLKGYSGIEVEHILGWHGTPGNLVKALFDVGFIEKEENEEFFTVHDWGEHAGFLKSFRINGKRWAKKRWSVHGDSNGVSTDTPMQKKRKEKKRKENKDNDKDTTAFASVEPQISTPPTTTPQADFVTRFKSLYEKMTGQPFNDTPRHYKLAHDLIQKHGMEAVILKAKTLAALCSDGGRVWFTSGGWADFSIEKLSARWNDIIPEVVPLTKEEKDKQRQDAAREEVREFNERTRSALDV